MERHNFIFKEQVFEQINQNQLSMAERQPGQVSLITEDSIVLNKQQEQDHMDENLGFMKRYFGPMREGSLRAVIFTLLASAMGTGIFNLPLRVKQIGIGPFLVFLILATLFSMTGMILMIRLIRRNKFTSYSEMSLKSWGNGFMRLSQFCIIIYPWGITICFQVILAKFVLQLLNDNFGVKMYEDGDDLVLTSTGNICRILINLGAMVLAILLGMKKDIEVLQKVAIVGVASVIFNIICILTTSFIGFTRSDDPFYPYHGIFYVDWSKVNWGKFEDWEDFSFMFQGLASLLFCFVNHQLLFPLTSKLKRPSKKRFAKIINRSHIALFIFYMLIGILAYLLLLEHDDRHHISAMVIASITTFAVTVGKSFMVVALFFAVPLNTFPARQSIFEAFAIQNTQKNFVIVTLLLFCSSCGIAITFQAVNSYFGLLGGTAGVLMAAGIPALCYYKLTKKLSPTEIAMLVLIAIVTVICFTGAILSLIAPPKD